jgi:hypothetical protein
LPERGWEVEDQGKGVQVEEKRNAEKKGKPSMMGGCTAGSVPHCLPYPRIRGRE